MSAVMDYKMGKDKINPATKMGKNEDLNNEPAIPSNKKEVQRCHFISDSFIIMTPVRQNNPVNKNTALSQLIVAAIKGVTGSKMKKVGQRFGKYF